VSLRKILYTPSGRAGAYANGGYSANIFKGCTHGCKYCYVPNFLKMNAEQRKAFKEKVVPAPDVLARITKDVKRLGKLPEPVFLCFTCDPYPSDPTLRNLTRSVITTILDSGNSVNILTKGGLRACRDFDLLAQDNRNKIGATLTFNDLEKSQLWEPSAPSPRERIEMLKEAKRAGIFTWVSCEPVIEPDETIEIMLEAMPYVDEFKIGKWNHDKSADVIDWRTFAKDAVELMDKNGKRYVIKDDLKAYL
jgi:DNA repair photolyase